MTVIARAFAAYISFAASFLNSLLSRPLHRAFNRAFSRVSNRPVDRFGIRRLKRRLSKASLKAVLTQGLSLTLIFSILAVSTPAAPTVAMASLSELGQDIRYSYLSHGELPSFSLANFSDSLASIGFFGTPLLAFIYAKGKSKKQERPAVARIEITPGQAAIREGEEIAFTAIGYDAKDVPVQGIGFNWQAVDARRKTEPASLPSGVFNPDYPGAFDITAEAGGISTSVRIMVVPDAPLKALKERDEMEKAGKDAVNNPARRVKALRSEVLELMAQPLPAPINNSSRMTKETVQELEQWDKADKLRRAPIMQAPISQQKEEASSDAAKQGDTRYLVAPENDQQPTAAVDSDAEPAPKVESKPDADESSSKADPAAFALSGQFTGVNATTRVVTGWAYNPDSPYSTYIYIYVDGSYAGYTTTYLAGCPPTGGSCSFSYTLPVQYADGVQHTLAVTGYDYSIWSEVPLGGSPQTFTLSAAGYPNWNNSNWNTADDPGLQPGNPPDTGTDQAGSSNFSFSAPVVSLGGGRGMDINLSLNYNSLLWHRANGEITYDIDKGSPAPGWSLGYGKLMDMASQGGSMIEGPDGTRHSYDGTLQAGSSPGYSTYYGRTTDGSFIDYVSNRTPTGVSSGTAYLPDGTIITYGAAVDGVAYPTQIKDRNGNYMTITYRWGQGPTITNITDTKGRSIQFNYDSYNRLVSVTGPAVNLTGVGNNPNQTCTLVRIHYKQMTLGHNFSGLNPLVRNANPYVIDAIYYPATNTGYWFNDADSYSSYGMIAKVLEQRGMSWSGSGNNDQGTITQGTMTRQMLYGYPLTASQALTAAPQYPSNTETWAHMEGALPAVTTSYSVNNNSNPRVTATTMPNGNTIKQYSFNSQGVAADQWKDGLLVKTEILSPSSQILGKSEMIWEPGDYDSARVKEVQTTDEKNQTTKQKFYYDAYYNQLTFLEEYGYSNDMLRKRVNIYENGTNYRGTYVAAGAGTRWSSGRHIFGLVKTEEIQDPNGARLGKTDYSYDGAALIDTPNVVNYDQSYNPASSYFSSSTGARGNVTQTMVYEDAANLAGGIAYDSTYDITGNLRTTTTNCCQQMRFDYTQNTQYSQPEAHAKGSPTDPNAQITETAVYDFNTGTTVHSTDFNGRQSTYFYDAALRPAKTVLPTGGYETFAYDDAALYVYDNVYDASNQAVSRKVSIGNGRGQVRADVTITDGNVWNATDIKYDSMGRKQKVSMPYTGQSAAYWTEYQYDQLSRVTQVTAPDGSASQTFYNETSRPDSASNDAGQTVRSRDAWGRERWARTDAFGRLREVVEPNPSGAGSVMDAGSLQTSYAYDAKDQLATVYQGVQQRWFAYDSLGRLTRQKLAEQTATINDGGQYVGAGAAGANWSDAFQYDQRSNLTQRTDARGVKTNFNYNVGASPDPLNRLQGVSYDTTSADTSYGMHAATGATMEYMPTGDKTRVKKVIDYLATEENAYDIEGRISDYTLTIAARPNHPLVTSYLYDTVNRLTEVRYPAQYGVSGNLRRMVTPGYDESSRLKELKVNNQIQMSDIVYNPMSQVTQLKTGAATGNADIETYSYDNQTGLLTNQTVYKVNNPSQPLLNLSYEYNRGQSNGTLNGKTGQLTRIVNNLDYNKNRVFEFDTLGRLKTAKGGIPNGAANWTQSYGYDRYGNRETVSAAGVTFNSAAVPTDGLPSLSYDKPSNRINTAGYVYDLAGNLVRGQDAAGNWQKYEYDAAGRLIDVKNDAGTVTQQRNLYGAGRQRLYSSSDSTTEITYYCWGGESVLSEYTTTAAGTDLNWKKSYVYAGSRLLSTATNNNQGGETTEFHHPDRLGTKLVTNNSANTSFEQSTLPFGTSLDAEAVGTNTTNQRFTSYDRSTAANLDYAVNRSYSSGQGRFTSVDPIGMSAMSQMNPQSNNLYAYVRNNPVDFTDPSGLLMYRPGKRRTYLGFYGSSAEDKGNFDWLYDESAGPTDEFGGGGDGDGPCITSAVKGAKELSSQRVFLLNPNGSVWHDGWHVLAAKGSEVTTLKELQGEVLNARYQGAGLAFVDVYVKGVGIAIYKDLGTLSVTKGQSVTTGTKIGEIGIKGEGMGLHFALFVGSRKDYNEYRSITSQIGYLDYLSDHLSSKLSLDQYKSKLAELGKKQKGLINKIRKEWFASNLSNTPVGNCPPEVYNKTK